MSALSTHLITREARLVVSYPTVVVSAAREGPRMGASARWLVAVGGVIATAVIVSVVVAVLGNREQEFDPGTPEAAVQDYLRAIAERDTTRAFSVISHAIDEECAPFPSDAIIYGVADRFSARLKETVERGDRTEVRVALTESWGSGPFDSGESNWEHTFVLIYEDGQWRFDEVPWPLYCPTAFSGSAPTPVAVVPASS